MGLFFVLYTSIYFARERYTQTRPSLSRHSKGNSIFECRIPKQHSKIQTQQTSVLNRLKLFHKYEHDDSADK